MDSIADHAPVTTEYIIESTSSGSLANRSSFSIEVEWFLNSSISFGWLDFFSLVVSSSEHASKLLYINGYAIINRIFHLKRLYRHDQVYAKQHHHETEGRQAPPQVQEAF